MYMSLCQCSWHVNEWKNLTVQNFHFRPYFSLNLKDKKDTLVCTFISVSFLHRLCKQRVNYCIARKQCLFKPVATNVCIKQKYTHFHTHTNTHTHTSTHTHTYRISLIWHYSSNYVNKKKEKISTNCRKKDKMSSLHFYVSLNECSQLKYNKDHCVQQFNDQ